MFVCTLKAYAWEIMYKVYHTFAKGETSGIKLSAKYRVLSNYNYYQKYFKKR